jgi:hypothetical protein
MSIEAVETENDFWGKFCLMHERLQFRKESQDLEGRNFNVLCIGNWWYFYC